MVGLIPFHVGSESNPKRGREKERKKKLPFVSHCAIKLPCSFARHLDLLVPLRSILLPFSPKKSALFVLTENKMHLEFVVVIVIHVILNCRLPKYSKQLWRKKTRPVEKN